MGTGHKEGGKFHPHTNSNNGMSSDKIEKKKAVNPNWKVNRDNEQHLSPDEIEKFMDFVYRKNDVDSKILELFFL